MNELHQQVVRFGQLAANPDQITEEERRQMLASIREQNARVEKVLEMAKELHPEQFPQTPEEEAAEEAEFEVRRQEMFKWFDDQAEQERRKREAWEKRLAELQVEEERERQRRAALGWYGRWREAVAKERQRRRNARKHHCERRQSHIMRRRAHRLVQAPQDSAQRGTELD